MNRILARFRSQLTIAPRTKRRMRTGQSLVMMLAVAALAASCSSPTSRVATPASIPPTASIDTPPVTITAAREIRYYVDEDGGIWDDRGRRVEAIPAPPR